ncbi:MAG TPA: hypothetical protein VK929_15070 [Longimicrobiales bacterium]|nr:hypothetical protein [Longimicrobiales bacterium]
MRAISRLVLVAALLFGLAPASVSAQRWTADWGVNGGASWYSELLDDNVAGPEGARFRAGWLVGSQLTFWPAERIGIRANMTYTDRPIVRDGDVGDADLLHGNINLWSGSGDLLIRLRSPNESWIGRETLPYIALGLGAKWVNPAGDHWTCTAAGETEGNQCAVIHPTGGNVAVAEKSTLMGLVGLGADFRMSPRTSLRLEINDRIYRPEVYNISSVNGASVAIPNTTTIANTVHEVGAQLGLHFLMGLRTPPPVAVAPPPPAPPPPPPPPPAPEPPREDAITVCVIDPSATGGIRMQAATFRHAQRDTIVMVDGQARPLRQVVGTGVMTARDAGWYVRGEPLELTVRNETIRFLPYQTATVIEPARIVYVGNVRGYPVYADRDEIADVLPALQTARGTRTDVELGTLLADVDARTRDVVQRATFMYVPLDPYGCVFQPVQRVEDVRKGK